MADGGRALIEGRPVLVVIDIQGGASTGGEASMPFMPGYRHDYFCRVVEDVVAGSSTEVRQAALVAREYLQTGARRSSAEVLAAFAPTAGPNGSAGPES